MKYRILLFILLVISPTIKAQQAATIKSVSLTTDHISSRDRRKDINGVFCALVKIQVLDDIERVEGNKIGDIIDKGVEKWVYMCNGSPKMKIHLKNHLPIEVVFQKYRINKLESNRVYELIIDIPTTPILRNVKGNDMVIKVFPNDARIVLWGDNVPKRLEYPTNGEMKLYVPYGRYNFYVEADGYHRQDSSIFVNDEKKTVEIMLSPVTQQITIISATKKAEFYINGVKMKKSSKDMSWTGALPPSTYIIEARAKGFVPQLQVVDTRNDESTQVDFGTLTEERVGKKADVTTDVVALHRESVMRTRMQAIEQAKREKAEAVAKADSIAKENSYDIVHMLDGSFILCHVSDCRDNMMLIKQKGNDNVMRIPTREIKNIKYRNGESEEFDNK